MNWSNLLVKQTYITATQNVYFQSAFSEKRKLNKHHNNMMKNVFINIRVKMVIYNKTTPKYLVQMTYFQAKTA